MNISVFLLGLWVFFVSGVYLEWWSVKTHTLGIVSLVIGLIVMILQVWPLWDKRP